MIVGENRLASLVSKTEQNKFSKCFKKCPIKNNAEALNEIDEIFDGIDMIYESREQYNLEWAFDDAQEKLNDFTAKVIDKEIEPMINGCGEEGNIKKAFKELQKMNSSVKKKIKWYFRLFSNMYLLLSIVEIAISLVLVIGLSKLSHHGEGLIGSASMSMLFVGLVAFFKVTIEKYIVKPKIDEWGWKLYYMSAKKIRRVIAIMLSTSEVLGESVVANDGNEVVAEWISSSLAA